MMRCRSRSALGQTRIVIALDEHAAVRFAAHQVIDVLAQFMDVETLAPRRATGPEHGIDQRGETIRFADDHLGIFAHRLVAQLAFQQLRGTAQTAQRILDLVSKLANHQPTAPQLRQERGLAADTLSLGGIAELHQQAPCGSRRIERRHADVGDPLLARVCRLQGHFALRTIVRVDCRASQYLPQLLGCAQKVTEQSSTSLMGAHAQEVFRSQVGIQHPQLAVEQQHAGAEGVENLLCFGDRRQRMQIGFGRHARHRPVAARAGVISAESVLSCVRMEVWCMWNVTVGLLMSCLPV